MLHDFGLVDSMRLEGTTQQCFTLVGARAADDLARRHGWDDRRASLVADAITLHLNVSVNDRHGREAALVRAGSGADAAGLGLEVLHRDQIDAVVARYPRLGWKQHAAATLAVECRERPNSRIAFLHRRLGFGQLVLRTKVFAE